MGQHAKRRRDVRESHDRRGGARDPGSEQCFAAGTVGKDDVVPGERRFAHALGVEIERHVTHAFGVEQPREALAVAAVTQDHHVALGADRLCGDAMQLERAQHPFRTRYAHDDGVGRRKEERGGEHRQDHRCEHRLRQLVA